MRLYVPTLSPTSPFITGAEQGQQLVQRGIQTAFEPKQLQAQLQAQLLQNQMNQAKMKTLPQSLQEQLRAQQLANQINQVKARYADPTAQANLDLLRGKYKHLGDPTAAQFQMIPSPQGYMRVNKLTGEAQLATDPTGKPIMPPISKDAQGNTVMIGPGNIPIPVSQETATAMQSAAPQQAAPQQVAAPDQSQMPSLVSQDARAQGMTPINQQALASYLQGQQQAAAPSMQQVAPQAAAQGAPALATKVPQGIYVSYDSDGNRRVINVPTTRSNSKLLTNINANKQLLRQINETVPDVVNILGNTPAGSTVQKYLMGLQRQFGSNDPRVIKAAALLGPNFDGNGSLLNQIDISSQGLGIKVQHAIDNLRKQFLPQSGDDKKSYAMRSAQNIRQVEELLNDEMGSLAGQDITPGTKSLKAMRAEKAESDKRIDSIYNFYINPKGLLRVIGPTGHHGKMTAQQYEIAVKDGANYRRIS